MTVVIPTFGREEVLVKTLRAVLRLGPEELIVVDQTLEHERETARFLEEENAKGRIQWVRLSAPSIPGAMNSGLLRARSDLVLFLDDDVEPTESLLVAHEAAHSGKPETWVVVGQILQPVEEPLHLASDAEFRFCSDAPRFIQRAMAGNMSVKRGQAIQVGGFDENFLGAAYMFETEFAGRVLRGGGKIFFEPAASLRHLRALRGGTRSAGSHLCTVSPAHASGAYYHLFLSTGISFRAIFRRLFFSVATRHHLRKPWWIPVTLVAEIRGLCQAAWLFLGGPRLLSAENVRSSAHS